jgi:ABC-type transport system involved in cytochrome bd biosynthesis fused ATPase/permease subunit
MRRGSFLVGLVLFLLLALPVAAASEGENLKQAYTENMAVYRNEFAKYDVDRKLYQRNQTETYLQTALSGARQTFAARQKVMVSFNAYLAGLLDAYVGEQDSVTVATLKTQLVNQSQNFLSINGEVSARDTLYRADDDFARIIASTHETAYASFAQIYFAELSSIHQEFTRLYQNQNQRILTESTTDVERESKRRILDQVSRAITNLQTKITAAQANLTNIDDRDKYFNFRTTLNSILAELETNLKLYANLE